MEQAQNEQPNQTETVQETTVQETTLEQHAQTGSSESSGQNQENAVEQPQHAPVSFDTINPLTFQYSGQYKCALSTAGQIVNALSNLSTQITTGTKLATNDYQKCLYPSIGLIANGVVVRYNQTFIDGVTDPLAKQVYGANLNGSRNDGRLNRPVTIRGVNKFLRYEYSQLGQLLNLLRHRLTFISSRNATSIKRYAENEQECAQFVALQALAQGFCQYLSDEVYPQWEKFVNDARIQNSIKLNVDNVKDLAEKSTEKKPRYEKRQHERKPYEKKVHDTQPRFEKKQHTTQSQQEFTRTWSNVKQRHHYEQQVEPRVPRQGDVRVVDQQKSREPRQFGGRGYGGRGYGGRGSSGRGYGQYGGRGERQSYNR